MIELDNSLKEPIKKRNNNPAPATIEKIRSQHGSGYAPLHEWVRRHKGVANQHPCLHCGTTERLRQWANIDNEYRKKLDDYIPLCQFCHAAHDKKSHCKRGHELEESNLYWFTMNGRRYRQCRKCRRIFGRQYRERQKMLTKFNELKE